MEIPRTAETGPGEDAVPRTDGRSGVAAPGTAGAAGARSAGGPREERLIWMFGSPRTGSTWLSRMMAEFDNQERWHEPYVGLLFGSFLYERLQGSKLLGNASFIMGEPHKKVWLRSIKNFLLEGAGARFPNLRADQYLVIKEPNGSVGAPLLLEATPASRLVFLIRDPRDVVASRLDAFGRGGWTGRNQDFATEEELNAYTRRLAGQFLDVVSRVREAFEAHERAKVLVRYESLRADPVGTMRRMYDELGIEVAGPRLEEAVARHSWERLPEDAKGSGKFYRKARPGGWREDLTPEQARIVEEVAGPIIAEYYA